MKDEHCRFRKTNLYATLLTVLFFLSFNLMYAQKKFSFSFKDVPLKAAIADIERQTGYKFVNSTDSANLNRSIKADIKDATLDGVLHDLLKGTGITYSFEGRKIILSMLQPMSIEGEKIRITGTVYDEDGNPFPYLTVFDPEHPALAVVTDEGGKYAIEVPISSKKLNFSFIGYKTVIVDIGKNSVINQNMELDVQNLNEVVVVGFGQQTKASVTASISSIKSDEIIQSPVANVTNAIAGRVAGLTAIQSSGQPGLDDAAIYVRGVGTWNSAEPLYVIDGVERTQEIFASMDASEIESLTVLKDAASTAVYGSKGANGVIIITSKRGTEGKVAVTLNFSTSLQQFTRYPKYLNSYESLKLYNEALMNDGQDPIYTNTELEHYRLQDDPYRYPNTDWYKLMMKKVAPTYNASLSLRGGSRTVRYFISGSFMHQEGQLKSVEGRVYNPKFSYERYRVSANIDALITRDFTISIQMAGSIRNRLDPYSRLDIFKNMNRIAPWYMPATNPDGSYAGTAEFKDMNPMWMINTKGSNEEIYHNVTSSVKLNYDFNKWVKGLSIDARIAFDSTFSNGKYRTEVQSTYQLISRSGRADRYTSYLEPVFFGSTNSQVDPPQRKLDGLANIIYSRNFGSHSVRIQGVANFAEKKIGSRIPYNSVSFIGRINYSFKNKYYFEANGSYRGSENFAPGRRFGFFPSFSGGWNIHEENFIRNHLGIIDVLKFRASYGLSGNDWVSEDDRFIYKQGKWTTGTGSNASFGYQGGTSNGYTNEPAIANPLATWEKAEQINLGADLTIWNKRLTITFDRFFEKRTGILQDPNSVPSILGIGFPIMNLGKTTREGWELEVSYNHQFNKYYELYVKGNIAFTKNKIVYRDEPSETDWWRSGEGKPINQFFGYVVEGFFQNQEEIDNAPRQQVGSEPIPGDLRYMDFNGDGIVNTYDQVPIGYTPMPRYSYGISFGAKINNFDINVLFQGTAQSSVFISQFLMYEFYNRGKVQDIHLGRWTPETAETATYPALHIGAISQNHNRNTFFIKDNPYIRLKNIEIAYNLGSHAAKKIGMKGLRIYLSGVNLMTWDKLKVVDPETPNNSIAGIYPQARTFSLGFNCNF